MQTQIFNISLPKDLVKKADLLAKKEYRNRSELIREALRKYVTESEEWESLYLFGEKQAKKLKIKNEEEIATIVKKYRQSK